MLSQPLLDTQLSGLPLVRRGKVRDVYDAGDALILVATDRISAFDYVLGSGIPDKGRVLNQLSAFWFQRTSHIVSNHLLSTIVAEYPANILLHAATCRASQTAPLAQSQARNRAAVARRWRTTAPKEARGNLRRNAKVHARHKRTPR